MNPQQIDEILSLKVDLSVANTTYYQKRLRTQTREDLSGREILILEREDALFNLPPHVIINPVTVMECPGFGRTQE